MCLQNVLLSALCVMSDMPFPCTDNDFLFSCFSQKPLTYMHLNMIITYLMTLKTQIVLTLSCDKIKPLAKRNELYNGFTREANIAHAQLRMQCSNLDGHLYNLHVIDSPKCSCSWI